MKNRSLKAGGRLNRWSLKAGFTVCLYAHELSYAWSSLTVLFSDIAFPPTAEQKRGGKWKLVMGRERERERERDRERERERERKDEQVDSLCESVAFHASNFVDTIQSQIFYRNTDRYTHARTRVRAHTHTHTHTHTTGRLHREGRKKGWQPLPVAYLWHDTHRRLHRALTVCPAKASVWVTADRWDPLPLQTVKTHGWSRWKKLWSVTGVANIWRFVSVYLCHCLCFLFLGWNELFGIFVFHRTKKGSIKQRVKGGEEKRKKTTFRPLGFLRSDQVGETLPCRKGPVGKTLSSFSSLPLPFTLCFIASRKDRRKKILLNRTFRPHGLPQQVLLRKPVRAQRPVQ